LRALGVGPNEVLVALGCKSAAPRHARDPEHHLLPCREPIADRRRAISRPESIKVPERWCADRSIGRFRGGVVPELNLATAACLDAENELGGKAARADASTMPGCKRL